MRQKSYIAQMERELQDARELQLSIIPSEQDLASFGEKTGLDCADHYEPSLQLGGDFWGLLPFDDGRGFVYMVDFAGHGVGAAMNTFRLQTVMDDEQIDWTQPDQAMAELNQRMCRTLAMGKFATIFLGILDRERSLFTYAAAGVPPIFVLKPDGEILECETRGMPIGISADAEYELREVPFNKGDVLFAYSDALVESKNRDGVRAYGVSELRERLANVPLDKGSRIILDGCLEDFFEQHDRPLQDDLTILVVS